MQHRLKDVGDDDLGAKMRRRHLTTRVLTGKVLNEIVQTSPINPNPLSI